MRQNVLDSVETSMTSAIPLLFPIATLNKDRNATTTYFDTENGVAITGYRRQVANLGVLLVRLQYGRHNEVQVDAKDYRKENGVYNYVTKHYQETSEGLLGREGKSGNREKVNHELATKMIDDIRDHVAFGFEVELSPGTISSFIDKRHRELGTHENKKVNFQFLSGQPTGTVLGVAERPRGHQAQIIVKVPVKGGGHKLVYGDIAADSPIREVDVIGGEYYLVKPHKFVKETGERTFHVLRFYKTGIRMAIQSFQMGLIKPGDKGYAVNPDPTNGLKPSTIFDMPFSRTQDHSLIKGAPPLVTFDLDMFYALMKTLSSYEKVTMKFKNSADGIYLMAEGHETLPNAEAIMGPTIQYVRGRVCLP